MIHTRAHHTCRHARTRATHADPQYRRACAPLTQMCACVCARARAGQRNRVHTMRANARTGTPAQTREERHRAHTHTRACTGTHTLFIHTKLQCTCAQTPTHPAHGRAHGYTCKHAHAGTGRREHRPNHTCKRARVRTHTATHGCTHGRVRESYTTLAYGEAHGPVHVMHTPTCSYTHARARKVSPALRTLEPKKLS